ncbi:MAG TPA: hypothetical protein VES73_02800 [Lamprocystis sp. (in: g-proteobacteria)]|nr:hypothetical protein [Lamprocystis sp. (in: g-proteobacteria)]
MTPRAPFGLRADWRKPLSFLAREERLRGVGTVLVVVGSSPADHRPGPGCGGAPRVDLAGAGDGQGVQECWPDAPRPCGALNLGSSLNVRVRHGSGLVLH